jgi:hypothetical protein
VIRNTTPPRKCSPIPETLSLSLSLSLARARSLSLKHTHEHTHTHNYLHTSHTRDYSGIFCSFCTQWLHNNALRAANIYQVFINLFLFIILSSMAPQQRSLPLISTIFIFLFCVSFCTQWLHNNALRAAKIYQFVIVIYIYIYTYISVHYYLIIQRLISTSFFSLFSSILLFSCPLIKLTWPLISNFFWGGWFYYIYLFICLMTT